ncbi:MAG: dockerin type I repeat-containing protein [Clostridia bacterium]|nr:dockerin type I repeat-containing protein [Clostridia bacterium]
MKKFLALLIAAVMTVSVMTVVIIAYAQPGNDGNVTVSYAAKDDITIDGEIEDGEWPDKSSLTLTSDNLVGWFAGVYEGPIVFNTAWNDDGLYLCAVIKDTAVAFAETDLGTRFQIALNPGNIIAGSYMGLFFSFCPIKGSDNVALYRHNWQVTNDQKDATNEAGYDGKYSVLYEAGTVAGWSMECIIPWSMIASADRTADLNTTNTPLTEFDPSEEGAICTAMICYVPCDAANNVTATGKTGGDGWTVSSYDITLMFEAEKAATSDTESESMTEPEESESVSEPEESGSVTDAEESESVTEPEESETETDPQESETEPEETGKETVDIKDKSDVNGDGGVDNKDVVFLFRYASSGNHTAEEDVKYDVNSDGEVNNKDVVELFRYVSTLVS